MAIDDATRERAKKFVESGSTRVFADPNRFSGPTAKPAIITKEQIEREGFTNLRDYLNAKGNLKPRPDKVNPDMGAKADAAFLRERIKAVAEPTTDEIANQQRKEKLNKLKIASAGAESKMRQANALNMSRADFVGDAELRSETPSDLKQDTSEPETRTPKRAGNLTDMLGLSSRSAKGGSVSASSRGDGIAQRGKTRGQIC